jgi:rhodanese-related sulfurtransferase
MRPFLVVAVMAGFLLMGASTASPPDHPTSFISVEELKGRLDRKESAVVIDVRTRPEYDAQHIAGARSIPLRSMRERASQIPRAGLVVLY